MNNGRTKSTLKYIKAGQEGDFPGNWYAFDYYLSLEPIMIDDVKYSPQYPILKKITPISRIYKPFTYYLQPVPDAIASDILKEKYWSGQVYRLHTLFASLDSNNSKQILSWCSHFGVLERQCDVGKENFECLLLTFEHEIEKFKEIIQIHNLIKNGTLRDVKEFLLTEYNDSLEKYTSNKWLYEIEKKLYPDFSHEEFHEWMKISLPTTAMERGDPFSLFDFDFDSPNDALDAINNEPYGICHKYLETSFDATGVYLELSFPNVSTSVGGRKAHYKPPTYQWHFHSLKHALYLMLLFDICGNKDLKFCCNPLCSNVFIATREDKIYCSDTCKNRVRQQRHRAKVKLMETTK